MVSVKDVMRKKVVTADSSTNLYKISRILSNNNIGSVVITKNNKAIGIITERNIVSAIAHKKDLEKITAGDFEKNLISVYSSADLIQVTKLMVKNSFKRIPVIDNNKLVGIITEKEILSTAPELIEILSEKLKARVGKVAESDQAISGVCERCGNYSNDLRHEDGRWYCEDCRTTENYSEDSHEEY